MTFLYLIKSKFEKLIVNVLKGERLNAFLPSSRTMQRGLFPSLLFNIALEDLASVIRQEREIKCIQTGKEEIKQFHRNKTVSQK